MPTFDSWPTSGQMVHAEQSPYLRNEETARALGLTSATSLVIGDIVGTGVFMVPTVIAGVGTMSVVVLGVIAVAAMWLR